MARKWRAGIGGVGIGMAMLLMSAGLAAPTPGEPTEVSSGERAPIVGALETAGVRTGGQLVIWLEAEANDAPRQLWGRAMGRGGRPLGTEFPISRTVINGMSVSAETPAVAAGGKNEFLVVWSQRVGDSGGTTLTARRIDAKGMPLAEEFTVTSLAEFSTASAPSVAYGARRDEYVIAWEALPPGAEGATPEVGTEVYTARLRARRSGTPPSVRVSSMGGSPNDEYAGSGPAVAYNSHREDYLVVWHGEAPEVGRRSLFARTLPRRPSGKLGPAREISPGSDAALAFNPRTRQYVATGTSETTSEAVIFARRIRASGRARGKVARVAGDESVDSGPPLNDAALADIEAGPDRGYQIVFDAGRFASDEREVFTRRLGRKLRRGRARLVAGGDPGVSAGVPALAVVSRERELRVVWFERRDGETRRVLMRAL